MNQDIRQQVANAGLVAIGDAPAQDRPALQNLMQALGVEPETAQKINNSITSVITHPGLMGVLSLAGAHMAATGVNLGSIASVAIASASVTEGLVRGFTVDADQIGRISEEVKNENGQDVKGPSQ